ncbi:hypothetical protein D3C80_1499930 [compost metagenome]
MSGFIAFARLRSSRERRYLALALTRSDMRSTVSILWLRISGFASITTRSDSSFPKKSGISTSTEHSGSRARIAFIDSAKMRAPPSFKSSRATLVTTQWRRFIFSAASATRFGSSKSSSVGIPVFTAQKRHARVQISPKIINVAVRLAQHS